MKSVPKAHQIRNIVITTVLIVILLVAGYVTISHFRDNLTDNSPKDTCTTRQFSIGSTGNCVSDIQTMVNFIETDDLTQCSFTGAQQVPITGTYNNATATQVSVVQTWMNCYGSEEGSATRISINGIVNPAVWPDLCTYGYQFPKGVGQSTSPYLHSSLLAGKNAGC